MEQVKYISSRVGGYQPMGVEMITTSLSTPDGKPIDFMKRPPDAVESLLVHKIESDVIPQNVPHYKEIVYSYWDELVKLLDLLMELTAMSLDLPIHFFKQSFAEPKCVLRLAHYPPLVGREQQHHVSQDQAPQLRYGEHTDFTGYTILYQDPNSSGLEVKLPNGEWLKCSAIPESFIVNAGDLIQVWTNDVLKSNVHRVVNENTEFGRTSVVFFTGPHDDTLIGCLPGCFDSENPRKYNPIRAGDHLKKKLQASNHP
eukprot:TRINITY_DN7242_c1_g1_i4.p1 TRINITY_DN7242_c1_g1~~TRINITY_DN7242_c1_g1_i4.p1  ORF type:complete len:257 (-),score=42.25 TRINITY_DN7242_c1_g1_i4:120-890(-)